MSVIRNFIIFFGIFYGVRLIYALWATWSIRTFHHEDVEYARDRIDQSEMDKFHKWLLLRVLGQ